MASSGTFSKTNFAPGYTLRSVWTQTQDIPNNRSAIKVAVYLDGDYALYKSANLTGTNNVDSLGAQEYTAAPISQSGAFSIKLGETTRYVSHNANGSKTLNNIVCWFPFNATISGTYYGEQTWSSGSITLNSIPRAVMTPRVNGAWQTFEGLYVKVGGVWKLAEQAYIKIGGVWKNSI